MRPQSDCLLTLASLRHPNVVCFFGAGSVPNSGDPFLVTELMTNGSLRDMLSKHLIPLNWGVKKTICADIVAGMQFLHSRNPPMVHRDLKVCLPISPLPLPFVHVKPVTPYSL